MFAGGLGDTTSISRVVVGGRHGQMMRSMLASYNCHGWRDHRRSIEPLKLLKQAAAESYMVYTRRLYNLSRYCIKHCCRESKTLMPSRRSIPRISTQRRVVDDFSCLDWRPFVSSDRTISNRASCKSVMV